MTPYSSNIFGGETIEDFVAPTQSFISKRIDSLSARVLSLATLGTGIEMFLVFLGQAKTLNTTASTIFISIVMAAELALVLLSLFTQFGKAAAGIFAVVVFFTLCTWPLQILDVPQLADSPTPWVYEALGVAGIAATLSLPIGWATSYLVATPIIWVVIRESTSSSQFQQWDSLLGAIYVLLFSTSVSAIVVMLRISARRADQAGQQAALAAAESARVDALERERYRVDALVHDQVLTTLIMASQTKTEVDAQMVTSLSQNALDRLMSFSSSQIDDESPITVNSLFESLTAIAKNTPVAIEIQVSDKSDNVVPAKVAAAFSEATIQALSNSVQHAGRGVTRKVFLRVDGSFVKVVVQDDGKGFRPSRVSKDRLGIKLSIRERMESVGGKAKIDTSPNNGCKVILIWGAQ